MKSSTASKSWDFLIYAVLAMMAITCLLPFINIAAVSLSGQMAIITGKVKLWPVDLQIATYKAILKDMQFYRSLLNTVYVTSLGTFINLLMTTITAYPLIKSRVKGKKYIMTAIVFTMLFTGGLIPNYLLVKNLGLLNTFWALMLPGAIGTFYLIILRTFFMNIPKELEDAAVIDGCGETGILFRIFIPLSLPVLVTLGLFYAVGHWNSYMDALIYLSDVEKSTLQVRLRQLIIDDQFSQLGQNLNPGDQGAIIQESLKAAIVIVSTLPILIVYPFLQKYFVKGVMIGAIKG